MSRQRKEDWVLATLHHSIREQAREEEDIRLHTMRVPLLELCRHGSNLFRNL
jgi:polyribonucleotide nucleotidyltransferase